MKRRTGKAEWRQKRKRRWGGRKESGAGTVVRHLRADIGGQTFADRHMRTDICEIHPRDKICGTLLRIKKL